MKKLMFNDKYGLTQAVLEGRKTMTRRSISEDVWQRADVYRHIYYEDTLDVLPWKEALIESSSFKVGEAVAVAQRYKDIRDIIGDIQDGKSIKSMAGWNNKMFVRADLMPHQIRITNVRVERLQDISEEDCLREGIYKRDPAPGVRALFAYDTTQDQDGHTLATTWYTTARGAFSGLIDKVSGKGTWGDNPWALVYEFELIKEGEK